MLSILIPVYNFNVYELVENLYLQATECEIQFEIICFDDASDKFFQDQNRGLSRFPNVTYQELPKNIGRSKIRNSLAEYSSYDNLLFLDCDSLLHSKHFIKKYIIHIENYHVVYGGRIYETFPPLSKEKYFRWYYGRIRESFSVEQRMSSPYKSFMTNNFLIKKKAFLSIRLNESIIGYGHEDTMFGIRLKENNVMVKHINNPVVHIGLEDFSEFIEKTNQGLSNLLFISKTAEIHHFVRLYRFLLHTKKYKIDGFVAPVVKYFNKKILRNLNSPRPILFLFDLYKLGHLITLDRESQ